MFKNCTARHFFAGSGMQVKEEEKDLQRLEVVSRLRLSILNLSLELRHVAFSQEKKGTSASELL